MVAFRLRTEIDEISLLRLPWDTALEDWPEELSILLPAGTHRHVVRFVEINGEMFAVKELPPRLAQREYQMLDRLRDEHLPAVSLIGVASDRRSADGDELESALITRHLRYSLPYRFLFSEVRHEGLRDRVVDALAVLLVRLHTAGFYWGDCSLNNALFRRDAGALRAYVVDTETTEWHESLTSGQRRLELDVAAENVLGGLLDLQASDLLGRHIEPVTVSLRLVERYESLWAELHDEEEIPSSELGRIHARLARLNDLGFDTEEYELHADDGIARFRPTVVEEGHHVKSLQRLTGVVAHENQARRLLTALRGFGAWLSQTEGKVLPEAVVAYRWLTERYEPALDLVPIDLRDRLEDAEIFHEILEHNWRLNEEAGGDVALEIATRSYIETDLEDHLDERTVLPLEG